MACRPVKVCLSWLWVLSRWCILSRWHDLWSSQRAGEGHMFTTATRHEPLDWDRGLQWAQAVLKSHLDLSYADFRKVQKCLRQGNQLRRSGPEMVFSRPRWVERCGWFRGCLDFCCGSRNGGASAMRSIFGHLMKWNLQKNFLCLLIP